MNDKEVASEVVVSGAVPDRRRLFRSLLTLAGLGITGALLSRDETGLLSRVAAAPNPAVTTSSSVTQTIGAVALWDGATDIFSNNNELTFSNLNGLASTGNVIGVSGLAFSGGVGVKGTGGAIGVQGVSGLGTGVPLVAQGWPPGTQTASLQQWLKGDGTVLSVVDANGSFGIGTTSPQSHLFVVDSTTNPSRGIIASQNNSGAQAALMQMTKSRGTQTSPSAVANGDYVAAFNMNAYDGTSYLGGQPMAGWGAKVNGAVATGSIPTDLFFYTKASGTLDPYGDGVVRVVISSAGNVGIGTTSPSHLIQLSGGAYSDGSMWVNASDRNLKENFTSLDEKEILNRLDSIPIQKWNYKNKPQAAHIGPVAQDFYSAYQLGDSDKSIGTIDADGIALAAIKALHKTINEQQTTIQQLKAESAETKLRLAKLENRTLTVT